MKKSQKSKIVLCSILGLAAISIGSVGFATWLVGVNKTTETLTVQAVVDNSQNDSIYLDVVTTQEKFVVAESEAHEKGAGEIVGTQTNTGGGAIAFDDNALAFTFSTFQLSIGKGVLAASKPNAVTVNFIKDNNKFNWGAEDKIIGAKYTVKANGTEQALEAKRVTSSEYSYIEYSKTFRLDTDCTYQDKTTYDLYTLKTELMTQKFSWGTFFTRETESATAQSPVAFYNGIYSAYNSSAKDNYMNGAQTFGFADKIQQEIAAMYTAFKDKTLTVNAATAKIS